MDKLNSIKFNKSSDYAELARKLYKAIEYALLMYIIELLFFSTVEELERQKECIVEISKSVADFDNEFGFNANLRTISLN